MTSSPSNNSIITTENNHSDNTAKEGMKKITSDDYLKGRIQLNELTADQLENMNNLLMRVNELLARFGEHRVVTSGYRSASQQAKINPSAPKSKHLICAAIDLADSDKRLKQWCITNLQILSELGLWLEDPDSTPVWVHLQCLPPLSGNRVFKP